MFAQIDLYGLRSDRHDSSRCRILRLLRDYGRERILAVDIVRHP